jgi:hypothetical protein
MFRIFRHHTHDPSVLPDETGCGRFVKDGDFTPRDICIKRLEQLRPAAPDVQRQTAPELEFAVDLIGLPSETRLQLHALPDDPLRRLETPADEDFQEIGIGAKLRQGEQVIEKLLLRIGSKIDVREIFLRQRRQHGDEIIHPRKCEAESAAGEMRIAAALLERRSFKHEDARSILVRRDGGTQGRIAGPDDEDVGFPVR